MASAMVFTLIIPKSFFLAQTFPPNLVVCRSAYLSPPLMSHRNFTWPSLPHSIPNLLLCSLHQWRYNYLSSPKTKNLGILLAFSLLSLVLPHLLQFLLILLLNYHFGSPASLHPLFHSDQVSITSFVVYENVLIIGFLAWSLAPCSHSSFTEETQRSIVLIHTS